MKNPMIDANFKNAEEQNVALKTIVRQLQRALQLMERARTGLESTDVGDKADARSGYVLKILASTPDEVTMNIDDLKAQIVSQAKLEIEQDIEKGLVPNTVKSFGDLHDYRDANCYGGLCDDDFADSLIERFGGRDENEGMPDGMMRFINEIQDEINVWLIERHNSVDVGDYQTADKKIVGFEHQGVWVTNPFLSECGRFEVDPSVYGFEPSSTGGGFEALFKTVPEGSIMITDDRDMVPEKGAAPEGIVLGLYGRNGEFLYSNTLAEAILAEQIKHTPMADVADGKIYVGEILGMNDHVVLQKVARNGDSVAHDRSLLSRVLDVGDVVEIKYKGGKGVVKGKGHVTEVDR